MINGCEKKNLEYVKFFSKESIFVVLESYDFLYFRISWVLYLALRKLAYAIYRDFFFTCKIQNFSNFFENFLIFAQNIDCGYTLEPPRRSGSNEYPESVIWSKNKKNRCIPQFCCIKVGFNGYTFHGHVFLVESLETGVYMYMVY